MSWLFRFHATQTTQAEQTYGFLIPIPLQDLSNRKSLLSYLVIVAQSIALTNLTWTASVEVVEAG